MTNASPLRRQYLDIKRLHPDAILLFRLGDFYEMFNDDARTASEVLQIVLTSRELGKGVRIPMCGVPFHAAENYIPRLLDAGHKVAVCDQIGTPGSGLVDRQVTRVITPGTVIDDSMLMPDRNNYLAAIVEIDGGCGLAFADVTTGELAALDFTGASVVERVQRELTRIGPTEVLLGEGSQIRPPDGVHVSTADRPIPASDDAHEAVKRVVGPSVTAAGLGDRAICAAATLLNYLETNHAEALHVFTTIHAAAIGDQLELDEFTRRNLEVDRSSFDGGKDGSLLGLMDRSKTPMGARLIRRRLQSPLVDRAAIERRLDSIAWLAGDARLRSTVREGLGKVGDLERTVARIRRGNARPDELLRLARSLSRIEAIARAVDGALDGAEAPMGVLDPCAEISDLLQRALDPDGETIIRLGYDRDLDEARAASGAAKDWIADLQARLRTQTGIKALKVGYNRVFGYYIEVGKSSASSVPDDFEPRQTLTNSLRYVTPQLKEYESKVLTANERADEREARLFAELVQKLAGNSERLSATAATAARLDAAAAFSELAADRSYVRPEFTTDGELDIRDGRHPVVEATQPERFVPNDARMAAGDPHIMILTGPNMAGKSTFLRQVALIALMAQAGSYVPAASARLPIIDRIFTRVGARDDLASGRSTFLVEMTELSSILSRATPDSLIVLDEIGRGTSTYDGVSIAKSVVEFLHNHPRIRAKTIFATHYHELTTLAERLPRVANYNVSVAEQGGKVIFLHKIVPGASDRSYGIHVARLAGLPDAVTRRAEEILSQLEAENGRQLPSQMSLLPPDRHPVLEQIEALDLEDISPLEALNKLYEWRSELDKT